MCNGLIAGFVPVAKIIVDTLLELRIHSSLFTNLFLFGKSIGWLFKGKMIIIQLLDSKEGCLVVGGT